VDPKINSRPEFMADSILKELIGARREKDRYVAED
jgi:hypothetical protein